MEEIAYIAYTRLSYRLLEMNRCQDYAKKV
jgi:hypothetical protein